MKSKPAVAVIGCGYWGRNHVRTLSELGALYAVCDEDKIRAADLAGQFGVASMDMEDVLSSSDIDAVVLALPPQFHAPMALKIIAAGKHLLIEKPIALTVEDASAVVEAAAKTDLTVMTGHVLRFHPAFEALERMVLEGKLGHIQYIHSHRVGLGRFHTENDALWDIAPHDLSLILALTGEEPADIRGEGAAVLDHLSDFAHLHLSFPGGIRSHVFASRLNPYRERRLTVIGDKAMAVFDDVAPWQEKLAVYDHQVWKGDNGLEFETAEPRFIDIADGLPLTRECAHFIACIAEGKPSRTPVDDGLAVIKILSTGTVSHD
ncbi:Gfo/Idh/MocA family protein [Hoeflea prorocentri]|uniref:Gfo/Idh/MocA family oxidoreductase n=1 Tax=Hoeflea prorocentri TaxID=1922333 RepID=A0A9X3UEH0_9HYPH|nr:Gfo/Idh/MocA family oxidoreductase [Hoeflea prorocentri]MCY6379344.1 Gfo/Idh/MocA family oxidoreductase [Hoeflea prorocentri]MDA5397145.1 Gfo/Idh/MocA family oxidoreductase [Hoeflea prorocentri]